MCKFDQNLCTQSSTWLFCLFVCLFVLQPLSDTRLVITPDNVYDYASYISLSVGIVDRRIHVISGSPETEVLRIPLGHIQWLSTIKVTVGLKPRPASVDSDPIIELSDGTKYNRFAIVDPTNYGRTSPCFAHRASQDNTLVPVGSMQASVYQLVFDPQHRYGACTAAYNNGYINTARFNDKLDLSKELNLVVRKDDDPKEEYDFLYFIIEIV